MIQQPAANNKPALDEESFTRLLAAAYVMQEHQDRVRTKASPADLTQIIAQVVETQHEIQTRSYHGNEAFALIAKSLCASTAASGVAVGILNADKLVYRAGAGSASAITGSEIKKQDSLAATCLKTGTPFQSPLAQTDPRLNTAQCRKLGAQSLLGVPLYHDGRVEGVMELYFSQISGFGDSEMRAAELMAGVASEVIADGAEQELREELESERASVLQALEVLEPELQKIAGGELEHAGAAASTNDQSQVCRACGNGFIGNETSCGVCGASRATGLYPGAALQSKWAVLWERHLAGAEQNGMPLFRKTPPAETGFPPDPSRDQFANGSDASARTWNEGSQEEESADRGFDPEDESSSAEQSGPQTLALEPMPSSVTVQDWRSLATPPEAEETESMPALRVLRERPGDLCLAAASLLLLLTLLWALWPSGQKTSLAKAQLPPLASVKRRPRPKPPKLSLFEEAMVGLGLAVPPPTPEYMGDPNIKVWEDLQTALYYCPDTDLYGNTAKGRFTTQAEAQQDAFEPAIRKPCD